MKRKVPVGPYRVRLINDLVEELDTRVDTESSDARLDHQIVASESIPDDSGQDHPQPRL